MQVEKGRIRFAFKTGCLPTNVTKVGESKSSAGDRCEISRSASPLQAPQGGPAWLFSGKLKAERALGRWSHVQASGLAVIPTPPTTRRVRVGRRSGTYELLLSTTVGRVRHSVQVSVGRIPCGLTP